MADEAPVLFVEIRGVYDGVSAYVYRDGRIANRWDTDDWRGSTRWAATEDYVEKARDTLLEQLALQSGADGDHEQGDAER